MSEKMRESLSALMDDEANELELQRVLSGIGDDAELRQTWVRYHAVRSAVSGQELTHISMDISQRVRESLSVEGVAPSVNPLQNILRPVASFAVAASVAAVVVLGGQQLTRVADNGSYSASFVRAGGVPVQASLGAQSVPRLQPATRTAYRELARQRMQKYMQEHAEHAALNSPQGLVPFARVQQIKE